MDVAAALLARMRAARARSLAVVGTSKNAGKTVVVAALADRLGRDGIPFALCSIGRDGEAVDALAGTPKPRFRLGPGTVFATALPLVPRSPACEILAISAETGALGALALARARAPVEVEIAGPSTAAALRRVARALAELAEVVLLDGAIDRLAALRTGDDAVVVAVGAASAPTAPRAAELAEALVARLRLPLVEPERPTYAVSGALSAAEAAALLRAGERRQVVVDDPTRIAFGGRMLLSVLAELDLRCRVPLHPVACTVAPQGPERVFEPLGFGRLVAERTGLPTYDVYAGLAYEPAG